MKTDRETTVQELRDCMQEFVDERDWRQFHSPKNLSMSLAIEAGELMEHFQWITTDESRELSESDKLEAGEELADVICYSLAICNEMGLDISDLVYRKMEKNRKKYPASHFKGRFGHNDPRPVSE